MSRHAPAHTAQAHPGADGEAIIVSRGLTFDGEHGPLFSDVDLDLDRGLHAVHMPGGHSQKALLLTLAGRLRPSNGSVAVFGETAPRAIRRHCAIAAFGDIDDLDDAVTVGTVVTEQRRWLAPCSTGRVTMPTETYWLKCSGTSNARHRPTTSGTWAT